MGRGLAAILPDTHEVDGPQFRDVPVELIRPNPKQPRKSFDGEALSRLAESVAESGVVQPVVVHPLADGRYELIAGERRWRAARQAGLATVPAVLRSDDDSRRLQMALVENMAREDLNPVEEARACAALVEELGLSKEEVARRVGRSRSAISNLIRLLDLPDAVLGLIGREAPSAAAGQAGPAHLPGVPRREEASGPPTWAPRGNMAREDLNPVEEARACAALVEELGLSKEEVARRVGRSRSAISNLIRLLDLPDAVLGLIESEELSEGHGRALLMARDHDERRRLAREAARAGWSVRETERRAKGEGERPKLKALPHPDEAAAIGRAEDALERALGRVVRVSAGARGLDARIHFDDLDELLALAESLRRS